MKEINELLSALKEQEELNAKIESIRKCIVEKISPYKIGDVIEIKGYSYTGRQGVVRSVTLRSKWGDNVNLTIMVDVLKKDGTKTQFTAAWDSWSDEKLKDAIKELNSNGPTFEA